MKSLIILIVIAFLLVGCGREFQQFAVKVPVSANITPEKYSITYIVEYEDGTLGSKELPVSRDIYDQFIKKSASKESRK